MANQDPFLTDLKREIKRSVIAVIGAGVSMSTVDAGQRALASWTGLLENGVERCGHFPAADAGWLQRVLADIRSNDDFDLLAAADKISNRLKSSGGEYGRWLQDTVGALRIADPSIIQELGKLGVPIATTNYDDLLEEVTGRPAITWLQPENVDRWIRGDDPGILHLHGHWKDPRSVVLGIRSYEGVIGDERMQTILRASWAMRTFLFIGYGRGLKDPNFGSLLDWARTIFALSPYRHYRLARAEEVNDIAADHAGDRIMVLSYGAQYSDLAGFLRSLSTAEPDRPVQHEHSPALQPPAPPPPQPPALQAATHQGGLPERGGFLTMNEAERQIFGLDDSQVTRKLRAQFRTIAYSTADRPLYLTGDYDTLKQIKMPEHLNSYYQGRRDVLKLQCYDLPANARQIRARSMGNDPAKEYVPESWVFLETGGDLIQLVPTAWDGDHRYTLPPASTTQRIYIVAVYRDGKVFYSGADQIWIETADLAGSIDRVLIWFGGKVRSVRFQSAFQFTYGEPLRFSLFPEDKLQSRIINHKYTVKRFAALMQLYETADSVRKIHAEQQSWQTVLDVWSELCAAESDEWWSLELQDVCGHLVLTATGESAPAARLRSSAAAAKQSRGKRRKPS